MMTYDSNNNVATMRCTNLHITFALRYVTFALVNLRWSRLQADVQPVSTQWPVMSRVNRVQEDHFSHAPDQRIVTLVPISSLHKRLDLNCRQTVAVFLLFNSAAFGSSSFVFTTVRLFVCLSVCLCPDG